MNRHPDPGSFNSIQGFNRAWTVVQSHRDRKGNVVSWSFTCSCGAENFYKVRRHGQDGAYSLASDCVNIHRCPPPSRRKANREALKRVVRKAA